MSRQGRQVPELAHLVALVCWAVGVQLSDGVASVGLVSTAVLATTDLFLQGRQALPVATLRAWLPLWVFSLWCLAVLPLLGAPPSGTGIARLGDWLAIPFGLLGYRRLGARSRQRLAIVVGAVALSSALLAGLQHFGVWPGQEWFAPLAWTRLPFHRVYEPVEGSPGRFMAGGLAAHRLKFAHVEGLVTLLLLNLGLAQRARARWQTLGLCLLLFIAVLWFPYARMAGAALIASCAVALASTVRRRSLALALGAAVVVLSVGGVAVHRPLRARFLSGLTSRGSGEREKIWQTGMRAVREHPLTGTGWGRFRPSLYAATSTPEAILSNPGKAHNQALSIAAEVGLPGLLLALWALSALVHRCSTHTWEGKFGVSATVFFAILSLTHDPLYQATFSMALTLSFALALSPRQRTSAERAAIHGEGLTGAVVPREAGRPLPTEGGQLRAPG